MATYKIVGGDGKEYGPVDEGLLRQWIAENRVSPDTLVQAEGSTDWKPLSQFPEFASAAPGATPPPPGPRPVVPAGPTVKVPNHLVPAVLCTIFCCLPFGIPAIIYAAQVNGKLATGDLAGAQASSSKAKMWCWLSFGFGLFVSLVYLVFFGMSFARQMQH